MCRLLLRRRVRRARSICTQPRASRPGANRSSGVGVDQRPRRWAAGSVRRTEQRLQADLDQILVAAVSLRHALRSEEHTSELQSLMRISYAVICLKKKNTNTITYPN